MDDILVNLDTADDDQKLLAQVVSYYHAALTASPEALDYLRKRGVTNGEAVAHFRIGYANRTLSLKLPDKDVKAGREIRARLQQVGLFRATGHEHFNGCVVFPVWAGDGTGQIVDLYGRKLLGTKLKKRCSLDLYLHDHLRGVWNVAALAASDEIILCASVFDALTLWCCGYRNVTTTFAPDMLTDDHLAAFHEYRIKRVLVFNEDAVPRLLAGGYDCFQIRLPAGVSIEHYAQQVSDPAEALGDLIRKAEWLGRGQAMSPTTTPVAVETMPMPDTNHSIPDEAAPALDTGTSCSSEPVVENIDQDDEHTEQDAGDDDGAVATDPTPIRTASPLPPAPPTIDIEVDADEVRFAFGDRRYRVRGWSKNTSFDQLRVNLLVSNDAGLFVDSLDLYAAKHRKTFVAQAASELRVDEQAVKKDLGRILLQQDAHHQPYGHL